MPALPVGTDAATVLSHILEAFSERATNQQPPTPEDLQFLEAAVRLYGELCVKEANEP
jgi:hypothetical protein